MKRVVRLVAPLLATAVIWGTAFLGITSLPVSEAPSEESPQTVGATPAPSVPAVRVEELDSGFLTTLRESARVRFRKGPQSPVEPVFLDCSSMALLFRN